MNRLPGRGRDEIEAAAGRLTAAAQADTPAGRHAARLIAYAGPDPDPDWLVWLALADRTMIRSQHVSIFDLPDATWRLWADSGLTPAEAVAEARDSQWAAEP